MKGNWRARWTMAQHMRAFHPQTSHRENQVHHAFWVCCHTDLEKQKSNSQDTIYVQKQPRLCKHLDKWSCMFYSPFLTENTLISVRLCLVTSTKMQIGAQPTLCSQNQRTPTLTDKTQQSTVEWDYITTTLCVLACPIPKSHQLSKQPQIHLFG